MCATFVAEPVETGFPQRIAPSGTAAISAGLEPIVAESNVTVPPFVVMVIWPLPYSDFMDSQSCNIFGGCRRGYCFSARLISTAHWPVRGVVKVWSEPPVMVVSGSQVLRPMSSHCTTSGCVVALRSSFTRRSAIPVK